MENKAKNIDNLEAIKLFLNVPKTAFIIGADERIVRLLQPVFLRQASLTPFQLQF